MRTIERIARKICEAARDDPDLLAYPPMIHTYANFNQHILIAPTEDYCQPRPLWTWYLPHAEAAVRALRDVTCPIDDFAAWDYWIRDVLNEKEG